MAFIVGGWGFASFLYFKVMFDFMFTRDISVLAALLMAICFAVVLFTATGFYARKFYAYNAAPGRHEADWLTVILKSIPILFFSWIVFAAMARLIIYGFSKNLDMWIDFMKYNGELDKDFITFMWIVFLPFIPHWGMVIFGTMSNTRKRA